MKGVVDHLTNLVRIPSVSALSNRPMVEYAAEALHGARWQTRTVVYTDSAGIEKMNLIAAPPDQDLDNPASELAFVCHTDTVPFASDWPQATQPFIANGLLHGCGACDVKGFLACLLAAAAQLLHSNVIDGLRIVFTADEEVGCIGATHVIASGLVRPRRVVIGEPTMLHPARAGKGYCLAEVTVFGEEAHSALPDKGKSAIYRAARFLAAIEEFSSQLVQDQNSSFSPPFTTLNVGTIRGGTAKNIIPRECRFQLEWRPIPGQSVNTVPDALSHITENLRTSDPTFRWEFKPSRQQRGFETPAHSSLTRSLQLLTQREPTSIPFASEASLFAELADEVVVFGPGDMRTAHSNRECVPLDQMEATVAIVKSLMTKSF